MKAKAKPGKFRPVPDDARFATFLVTYTPAADECEAMALASPATRQAKAERWLAAVAACEPPTSLVDAQDGFGCYDKSQLTFERFVKRDEALGQQAEINAKAYAEWQASGKRLPDRWAVVVETGLPSVIDMATFETAGNGLGTIRREMDVPVRVVKATPAEMARHPFPTGRNGTHSNGHVKRRLPR